MLTPRTRTLLAALLLAVLSPLPAWAQRELGERLGRGAGGPGLGGPLELLSRPDVRKELELVDDQLAELSELQQQLQQRRREVFGELLQSGDREGARQRIQEVLEESNRQVQTSLQQILLPHQFTRLNQLQLQVRMRSVFGAFADEQLVEALGISEEQRAGLREAGRVAEQELRDRIAELRLRAQEKFLSALTPEQQAKFREMIGEPFEFEGEAGRGLGLGGRRFNRSAGSDRLQ